MPNENKQQFDWKDQFDRNTLRLRNQDNNNPKNLEEVRDTSVDSVQGEDQSQEEMEQRLNYERRQSIFQRLKQIKEESVQAEGVAAKIKKTQQTINKLKNIYRVINGTSAITIVGIIITFLIMNVQLILGNLFKFKFVPPLSWVEGLILLLLWAIVAIIIFLTMILIYFITNPCEVASYIGTWWAELLKVTCEVVS